MSIGEKIRELRKGVGLSQKELADLLNLSDKTVSKWETDISEPSLNQLKSVVEFFSISLDDILGETEENKKISRIVLTGGPCAGKTTAMSYIQNKFLKDGYKVIFVAETASELINSGVTPDVVGGMIEFEKILIKMQIKKEKEYNQIASKIDKDKILIIYDRGLADIKAYLSEVEYKIILNSLKMSNVDLRDNYDAVFHLVTAANGAEEFYTLDNNSARKESLEDAKILDEKTIDAWKGHPHLRIIGNERDFYEKMKYLLKCMSNFLGEPEPYEIERKFLIEYPNIKLLEKKAEKIDIVQTYLQSSSGEEVRLRQRGQNGSYTYYMTTKIDVSSAKRIEKEKRLSYMEYQQLLTEAKENTYQINKTRYCLPFKGQYLEIDIYDFWSDLAILEVELQNEDDNIKVPQYLKVIEEVTNKSEYRNYSLARGRYK